MIFNLGATDMTKLESMLANIGGGQKICIPSETVRYTFDAEEIIPEANWGESASITDLSCNLFYIPAAGDICVKLYNVHATTSTITVQLISVDGVAYSNQIKESSMPTMDERTKNFYTSSTKTSVTSGGLIGSHDLLYVILNVPSAGVYNITMSDAKYITVKKAEICYDFSDTLSFAKYE